MKILTIRPIRALIPIAVLLAAVAAIVSIASAQTVPNELSGIGISEHLGAQVSIGALNFKDEDGNPVRLSKYFQSGRPVLLTLIYYECPNLCNYLLNGLVESLKKLDWEPSRQFEIVTVSINPRERPQLAQSKKTAYLKSYGVVSAAQGWHFLTGEQDQIQKLASEVGFNYRYDESEKQYAHGAVVFALTPEGKVSRYLYGISFPPKDLKLALLEASNGKVGNVIDKIILFCFRYDAETHRYSFYLAKAMQAGSAVTIVIFGGYLAVFWSRQRRSREKGGAG